MWTPKSSVSHKAALTLAIKSKKWIALGTDLGLSGKLDDAVGVSSHGSNGKQLVFMVEAGMSPSEAIEAATVIVLKH